VKTLDQFDIRSQRTGVRNGACRPCMTEYKRLWYVANRGELIERARLRRDRVENENRARMWRYLAYHPCVDCGEPDPVVLEFDHIRDKRANVSEMVSLWRYSASPVVHRAAKQDGLLPPSLTSYGGQVVACAPRNDG